MSITKLACSTGVLLQKVNFFLYAAYIGAVYLFWVYFYNRQEEMMNGKSGGKWKNLV